VVRILSQLPDRRVRSRLAAGRLNLRIGPFAVKVRSALPAFAEWLPVLYGDHELADPEGFADFQVRVDRPRGLRRWWRPQAVFRFDGAVPFKPLPLVQALPLFEWGLNWVVARHAQRYLILHAAVVARDGRALLLPGEPGAGKSTLCAGLAARGWRLLSDELALIRADRGDLLPLPRPVSLKNGSLAVIRDLVPGARFGPFCRDTAKGVVAHVRPPRGSVERSAEPARPTWVVFPRFRSGGGGEAEVCPADETLRRLIGTSFNYGVQGPAGFHALADIAAGVPAYCLEYGDLERACGQIETLAAAAP